MARRQKPVNKLTSEQAAYLAGIVDGEGCFTGGLNRGYVMGSLEIGSVDGCFLKCLRDMVGAGNFAKKKPRKPKAKPLYVWHVHLGSLESLIMQILPFLRLKAPQAKLMLSLVRYSNTPSVLNANDPFQLQVLDQLSDLNHRGVKIYG